MTYNAGHINLKVEGDYVKLEAGHDYGAQFQKETPPSRGDGQQCWLLWWAILMLVGVLGAVIFIRIGPFLMDKEIIPIMIWERETLSKIELGLIIFGTISIFPCLLLPSSPSMWLAGMTFGYGYGFLLVIGGVTIGVSLPYFIGSLFYHKIQEWLDKYPKRVSVIRLAGEGNLFNQFRAVAFIRTSPFPYIIYNYCAVASDVKYGPYLLGTVVGMIPEIFLTLYTGIIIQTIADASHNQHTLSVTQVTFSVAGFILAVFTTVIVTIYAKGRLKELQTKESG